MATTNTSPQLRFGFEARRHLHGRVIRRVRSTAIDSTAALQKLTTALAAISRKAKRTNRHVHVSHYIPHTEVGSFFAGVLCVATSCSVPRTINENKHMRLRTLIFNSGGATPERFACLFSALPHAQSLTAVHLESSDDRVSWVLTELELRWIAYAICHPATQSSTWRTLVFGNCSLDVGATRVVEELASSGASAASLLSVTTLAAIMTKRIVSDAATLNKKRKREGSDAAEPASRATVERKSDSVLRRARIKQGAVIRTQPNESAPELVTTRTDGALEVCAAANQQREWHCVLVPGFGFGYVRVSDIAAVTAWTPAKRTSPLTALGLSRSMSRATALNFLTALGQSLTALTLKSNEPLEAITDDLARLCPALQALEVQCYRGPFNAAALERYFARPRAQGLRLLALNWEASVGSGLWTILSDSKTYPAVSALEYLRLFDVKDTTALSPMLRANRTLARIRFDDDLSRLRSLKHFDGKAFAPVRVAVSLLSALSVRALQPSRDGTTNSSVYAAMLGNRDALALICAYAAPRRVVHIGRASSSSGRCCHMPHATGLYV